MQHSKDQKTWKHHSHSHGSIAYLWLGFLFLVSFHMVNYVCTKIKLDKLLRGYNESLKLVLRKQ